MASPLARIIKNLSEPLEPLVPDSIPGLAESGSGGPGSEIKSVIFDIYGTLFISEAGDISIALKNGQDDSFLAALAYCKMESFVSSIDPANIKDIFFAKIDEKHRQEAAAGNPAPEVDIREIWDSVLSEFGVSAGMETVERIAVAYESISNRTWPMPGLKKTLTRLKKKGYETGIISNAQFYTPLLFEAHLGLTPERLGFNPELCYYSYRCKTAKPGVKMFSDAVSYLLENKGIRPHEILYVGNDMLNDMMPAASAGMRTALFAGDRRSLRVRKNERKVSGLKPDFIITGLEGLVKILDW